MHFHIVVSSIGLPGEPGYVKNQMKMLSKHELFLLFSRLPGLPGTSGLPGRDGRLFG